jgi:YaiO family outer membrane protein
LAKVNVQNRFGRYGVQYEIDAYPGLGKGRYAFLNIGYSRSGIFPDWRYGFQIYQNLPKATDISAGMRILDFGGDYVYIYTGTLGKYFGNSYIFLAPYLIPSEGGWSRSLSVSYRKYGDNEDQYYGIRAGFGYSPEVNRFIDTNVPFITQKAQTLTFNHSFKVKNNRNVAGWVVGIERIQLFFPEYTWIARLGLSYDLNY